MNKEEALDILRDLHEKSLFSERKALETFVPQLKESNVPQLKESKDEIIRKRLIFNFNALWQPRWGGLNVKDIIAWLEKQRKHKFDIGDTISNGNIKYRIVDIVKDCVNNDCYSLRRAGKIVEPFLWDCEEADELFEKL